MDDGLVSVFNLETEKWERITPEESVRQSALKGEGMCFPRHEWAEKQSRYEPALMRHGYKRRPKVESVCFYPAGHRLVSDPE